jgi:hypothetical protein
LYSELLTEDISKKNSKQTRIKPGVFWIFKLKPIGIVFTYPPKIHDPGLMFKVPDTLVNIVDIRHVDFEFLQNY